MVNWQHFSPADFEYDFDRDELAAHHVTFEEAVECFFADFEVRRNKSYRDRYQLLGKTFGGRRLKIIFQLKFRKCRPHHYWMDCMNAQAKTTKKLVEVEIDRMVIDQADDDAAWEKSIRVERSAPTSLSLSGELAVRAAFLAQLHRTKSVEDWLTRVIQERIELEEAAFMGIKQELVAKAS